ncbi:hypothetical protein J6590_018032 [Homalodisca vitripennis]|nr:hypothetical protein J6590_018032 [Homalodisca vitripennis]
MGYFVILYPFDEKLICDLCSTVSRYSSVFERYGELTRHFKYKHKKQWRFRCRQCGQDFRDIKVIDSHITQSHTDVGIPAGDSGYALASKHKQSLKSFMNGTIQWADTTEEDEEFEIFRKKKRRNATQPLVRHPTRRRKLAKLTRQSAVVPMSCNRLSSLDLITSTNTARQDEKDVLKQHPRSLSFSDSSDSGGWIADNEMPGMPSSV